MRKIRFIKTINEEECSELTFCGPSDRDGTYAIIVDCYACDEDIQIPLSLSEIEELHEELGRAISSIQSRQDKNR